ncbi:MAG: hypothetical protein U0Z75_07095 [Deinococcaceae bacterium]
MKTLLFIDLDDTLFQTEHKCPPGVTKHPVTTTRNDQPGSYMTPKQHHLFSWISATSVVIPTTGRDISAFSRVQLAFHDQAILNHGATILHSNGTVDSDWHEQMRDAIRETSGELDHILSETQVFCDRQNLGANISEIRDVGQRWYLVAKHPSRDLERLNEIHRFWHESLSADNAFYVIANGNNVALLPRAISKRFATEYLKAHRKDLDPCLTIGVGDSISDLDFMHACDLWLTPNNSQISGFVRDQLARSGVGL